MIRVKWLAPPLLLADCATVPDAASLAGSWGGAHVGLQLTATGGTLDYDCATGTIGPLAFAEDGSFSAIGTHSPAAGGPDRVGEVRPSFAAIYQGRVAGDRIRLAGRFQNGVELGPFTLRRGAEPVLFRCL